MLHPRIKYAVAMGMMALFWLLLGSPKIENGFFMGVLVGSLAYVAAALVARDKPGGKFALFFMALGTILIIISFAYPNAEVSVGSSRKISLHFIAGTIIAWGLFECIHAFFKARTSKTIS